MSLLINKIEETYPLIPLRSLERIHRCKEDLIQNVDSHLSVKRNRCIGSSLLLFGLIGIVLIHTGIFIEFMIRLVYTPSHILFEEYNKLSDTEQRIHYRWLRILAFLGGSLRSEATSNRFLLTCGKDVKHLLITKYFDRDFYPDNI